jgi:hypothetical protein
MGIGNAGSRGVFSSIPSVVFTSYLLPVRFPTAPSSAGPAAIRGEPTTRTLSGRTPLHVHTALGHPILGLGSPPVNSAGSRRICNPNGTLTMVATDQNSSMISMMKKATGKEPTYAEIATPR